MKYKPFIITIDTEGDNLWTNPKEITTRNSLYLPRFQALCEKYSFKPVYLTNWEMASCEIFQEFGKSVLKNNTAEIGMHLHAWNSPPVMNLQKTVEHNQAFLIEYSKDDMRHKIEKMTRKLEDVFQKEIVSHRAGRWAFDDRYLQILKEFNYKVDCSVTPHVNWGKHDDQYFKNNIDYSNLPTHAYFVNDSFRKEGNSNFLEVPVTIMKNDRFNFLKKCSRATSFSKRVFHHFQPEEIWLRPNGRNLNHLLYLIQKVVDSNADYAEFVLHSSELMPGGSPTFPTEDSIDRLYSDLEVLFERIKCNFFGQTLAGFGLDLLKNKTNE